MTNHMVRPRSASARLQPPVFLRWEYLRDLVCVYVCVCALTRLGIEDIVTESKAKGGIASPLVIHLIK